MNMADSPDSLAIAHELILRPGGLDVARVDQHLRIGMRAIDILRDGGVQRLHSRKLRSFAEVAFQ